MVDARGWKALRSRQRLNGKGATLQTTRERPYTSFQLAKLQSEGLQSGLVGISEDRRQSAGNVDEPESIDAAGHMHRLVPWSGYTSQELQTGDMDGSLPGHADALP